MSPKLPDLVRLYIRDCITGFALSGLFVGLILYFNVAGLAGLILGSPVGWIALLMFFIFNGLVFAGVQFAISVMLMADDDDDDDDKGLRDPVAVPALVPVRHNH